MVRTALCAFALWASADKSASKSTCGCLLLYRGVYPRARIRDPLGASGLLATRGMRIISSTQKRALQS
jgi:hypothetical protein